MVVPFASLATPQMLVFETTPSLSFLFVGTIAHLTHCVVARHLFGTTKPRGSRLALRQMRCRRTIVTY